MRPYSLSRTDYHVERHPVLLPPTFNISFAKNPWDPGNDIEPCIPYMDPESGKDTGWCIESVNGLPPVAGNMSLPAPAANGSFSTSLPSSTSAVGMSPVLASVNLVPHPIAGTPPEGTGGSSLTSRDEMPRD